MLRIVLDSNIVARAVMSPNGPAAALFTFLINSEHQLCTSDYLLAEVFRILSYPRLKRRHRLEEKEIESFVLSLQRVSLVVNVSREVVPAISRDANDDAVVKTAVLASAHYLCTMDEDILDEVVVDYCRTYGIDVMNDVDLLKKLQSS